MSDRIITPKMIEREKFKREAGKKYDVLWSLPIDSPEYSALWKEIQEDEKKLKELSREATREWIEAVKKAKE